MEAQNTEIEKTVVHYYMAMDNKDMNELKSVIYPDNKDYTDRFIMDMQSKMLVTKFESIKVDTIYPALIDGNIAIVGYRATTKSNLNAPSLITFQEIGTSVLKKKGDRWYIAKPIDLQNISSDYLNEFFNKYQKVLKENITEEDAEHVVNSQKALFSLLAKQ